MPRVVMSPGSKQLARTISPLIAVALAAAACGDVARDERVVRSLSGKADASRCDRGLFQLELPGWPGRPYDVVVPDSIECGSDAPVLLALHGGGADSERMARVTCPDGDFSDPACLDAVAERRGFIVVYPNGTPSPNAPGMRTWNAGGGAGGWDCMSGIACEENVDDVAYIEDLLDDLLAKFPVDAHRVYATGISNGGAMSHRLACELSDRIAAIASVAGPNQVMAVQGCDPTRPVPMLMIQGTSDLFVPIDGGPGILTPGNKVPTADTVAFWVSRNGCHQTPATAWLPNTSIDLTRIVRDTYSGCDDGASVVLLEVQGGGHTWPGGYEYSAASGAVSYDINAAETIWTFVKSRSL